MMGKIRVIAVIAMTVIMPCAVFAQNALETIVVTPNKQPMKLFDTLLSVDFIKSDAIQKRGYKNLEEILSQFSSISIGSNGGFGQTKSIFMRGTESNHTKVLLNGVELNPGTLGVPSIQHISVDMIDRIEISKGSMSTLYGKDTIGGTINIITKNNSKRSVKLTYGRYNTHNFFFSDGISLNEHKVHLNLSRNTSNSYKAKVASSKNHKYHNTNLDLNYEYGFDDKNIKINYYNSSGKTEYDSFGANLIQDHVDNHLNMEFVKSFIKSDLSFFYKRKGNEINQSAASATDFTHTKVDSLGLSYTLYQNQTDYIITGFDYTDESMYELSYGTSFKTTNKIKEIFFSGTRALSEKYVTNFGVRHINHSVFNDYLTGNFGLGFYVTPNLIIRSSIGKSFRAPDATDLFGYGGNEDLNPEESVASEIGLKYKIDDQSFFKFTAFNNKIKNLIESDGSSMQNINKAEIRGFEVDYGTKINHADITMQYTYQEADDLTNDTLLSRRPRNKLSINLSHEIDNKQNITLQLVGESKRDNSIYDYNRLGGYLLSHLMYTKTVGDINVGIRINNVFDKKYRLAHNYNTEGRGLFISLSNGF